jgi:hypothetical protein
MITTVLLHGDSITADGEPCGPQQSPCSSAVNATLLPTSFGDLLALGERGPQCAANIPPVRNGQNDEGITL